MALRAYTQDEVFNSSIGDDVYLQPDVDKELKRLTEENLKLDKFEEEIIAKHVQALQAKLEEKIEKLRKNTN